MEKLLPSGEVGSDLGRICLHGAVDVWGGKFVICNARPHATTDVLRFDGVGHEGWHSNFQNPRSYYRNSFISSRLVCGGASYGCQLECKKVRYMFAARGWVQDGGTESAFWGLPTDYNYVPKCRTTRPGYESLKTLKSPRRSLLCHFSQCSRAKRSGTSQGCFGEQSDSRAQGIFISSLCCPLRWPLPRTILLRSPWICAIFVEIQYILRPAVRPVSPTLLAVICHEPFFQHQHSHLTPVLAASNILAAFTSFSSYFLLSQAVNISVG